MRRKQQIDPKTLRKHSRIVEARQDQVVVAGNREQTDYGFFIEGHKGKSFETKFILIMPSCMTPKWVHAKKCRVLRVTGGVGHYETYSEDGNVTTRPITVGDEVVIEAGTVHRIRSSPSKLELSVSQDAKYEASLTELEPSETVAQLTAADLNSVTQEDKTHQQSVVLSTDRSMRRNRAREQIAAARGQQGGGAQQARLPGQRAPQSEDTFFRSSAAGGINEMPVANFDPSGAG